MTIHDRPSKATATMDYSLLTQVGAGTAMGKLLRCYWHPIATTTQLQTEPVLPIRLLGENLVLFRDQQNGLGLIDRHCPHRGVSLACGIPESNGLRCPYHGWLFDRTGRCLERPFEDHNRQAGIAVPHQLRIQSYPLHVHGGLIFAYLGTEPAPICPDWGLLARTDIHRQIRISVTPCNWFQIMGNALDPIHHEWLHGHFASYAKARQAGSLDYPREALAKWSHVAIRFRRFAYGIYKCRLVAGEDTVSEQWTTGHPIIFPNLAWFQSRS